MLATSKAWIDTLLPLGAERKTVLMFAELGANALLSILSNFAARLLELVSASDSCKIRGSNVLINTSV